MICKGEATTADELRVSRWTVLALALAAILLGALFEKQNVAFMVSLAFALAASGNFPVLVMSILWKDCTTRGAVWGGMIGLVTALVLTMLSPAVWGTVLGLTDPPFPYTSPAIVSMPLAFFAIWLISIFDRSGRAAQDRAGFAEQHVRVETGVGAHSAAEH